MNEIGSDIKSGGWQRGRRCLMGLIVIALMGFDEAVCVEVDVDWPRLFQGDILVSERRNEAGVRGIRAMFTVAAPRERIWATLVDYDNFPRMFPGIEELKVLAQDREGALLWFRTPVAMINYRYVLQRRYVEPGWRLTWTRVSGSFKSIDGSWTIQDTPRKDVYLMVYESYVRIGRLVPVKLVVRGAKRRVRRMSEDLRTWIETSRGHE